MTNEPANYISSLQTRSRVLYFSLSCRNESQENKSFLVKGHAVSFPSLSSHFHPFFLIFSRAYSHFFFLRLGVFPPTPRPLLKPAFLAPLLAPLRGTAPGPAPVRGAPEPDPAKGLAVT